MNYTRANEMLQGRNKDSRKIDNNTYLIRRPEQFPDMEHISVRLHNTDIINLYPSGNIVLNTGGWKTVTTKDRLNKYGPVRLSQIKSIWYYDKDQVYFDGITFNNGVCINAPVNDTTAMDTKALLKRINAYCKAINDLSELPFPSQGDCFLCSFMYNESRDNKEHLLSHIEENYIHGSLIFNALKWVGYKNPMSVFQMFKRENYKGNQTIITSAIRRYLKKQLGIA